MTPAISFPAISTKNARVLILGSMPGVRSLEMQQYYAHPQNAFWKIMTALFGMPIDSYAERVSLIKENDLALWDVLKHCERKGSLDSDINPESIEINDFTDFFKKHPAVTHVFLNGGMAATTFKKRIMPVLPADIRDRIQVAQLPSTSPAHATLPLQEKIAKWAVVRQALKQASRKPPSRSKPLK